MEKLTAISDLRTKVGAAASIGGWLYNKREKGRLIFLLVRDGSGIVQCVAEKNALGEDNFKSLSKVTQESSLIITGGVREDQRAPGGVEMDVKSFSVVGLAEQGYPIQIQDVVPDVAFLMQNRHLWLRSKKPAATMRVRAEIIKAIRDFLDSNGFVCVDSPIITPTMCEGTTTLFKLQYFDQEAFLTQSGQLYQEAAAMALGKVYCFGPAFRAEKSKTRKHLIEFWMVEPEAAFMELPELMEFIEKFISNIVIRCLERRKEELKILGRDISRLEKIIPPFPRFHYDEAVKTVNANGVEMPWGDDFGAPQEEALVKAQEKPVFVHRFPANIKAFYMQPDNENPKYALCCDVIAPDGYGEIVGGSQRIHDLNLLLQRMKEHNLTEEAYKWYVDLRKFGTVPHSGFGLGIERTVAWICGTEHIRECIPFPRMLYRIYP